MRTGSRMNSLAIISIESGIVAENIIVCRSARKEAEDLAHLREEAEVEHVVGFVEDELFDIVELHVALRT